MTGPVTAWSFSALKLYEECPAKYKYEKIDKVPYEKPAAMQRGIDIHKKAESFLKGEEMLPQPELMQFGAMFQELRGLEPLVEQQWGFTADWKATGWFAKGRNATWLRVIPDAVVLYEDGEAEIIDFKTGKPWGDNSDQMELFAVATFSRYPELHEVTTRLWYVDTGDEVVETYPKKGLAKRKRAWEDRVEPLFNETRFPPKPNRRCNWCPFSRANGGPCKY